nr:MAG TPA: dsDNA helicase [Caudoviricetes sp.]
MMNGKLKNAPNLKELLKQNPPPQKEIFILIGVNVWGFYRSDIKNADTNGQGDGWRLLADSTDAGNPKRYEELPILLDARQLNKISQYTILPADHQIASLIDTDGFFAVKSTENGVTVRQNQLILTALCEHLAKHSQVKQFMLKNNLGDLLEDLSGYIERIRKNENVSITDSLETIELDAETMKSLSPSDRAEYFAKWFKSPLAHNSLQDMTYIYNGIIWEPMSENFLQREIKRFFEEYGAKYRSVTNIDNIIKCLKVDLPLFEETEPNLLAFKNGVLNKHTLEFMPHDKTYYLTGFNPCDYLETKTPTPNFDKWLNFISYNKPARKKAILAALYMILNNRHDWQLTLELIGEPGGGKSTFLEIAKLISGEGNYAAMDLDTLKDNKSRDIILNKTFLFCPDQPKYVGEASIIKQISGGDDVTFNPKNKKAFSTKVKAIIAICSNTLPIYKHDGGGMERRRVLFPFSVEVDDKDKDVHLIEKIQGEIGGVIRKLYDEFPDANEAREALQKQKNSQEALEMKIKNDHILEFVQEFDLLPTVTNEGIIFGDARKCPSFDSSLVYERLYWCYLMFCDLHGRNDKFILKPSDLMQELAVAFKTAGHKIKFSSRTLKGGYRHTNAIFKDKRETASKWGRS